ncbi:MAG: GcvH-related protein [Desulfatirhabdiaceae bacterium]
MTIIEKFLGHRVTIPDNLHYVPKQGLWASLTDKTITFGFTEPALILSGGVNDLNFLMEDGDAVDAGQTVFFAITGKIVYIETPVPGIIRFNPAVKTDSTLINQDPYGRGWLFAVTGMESADQAYQGLSDCAAYLEKLQESEGFKNPDGIKGGVSGVCKAVYSGIRMQKINQSGGT